MPCFNASNYLGRLLKNLFEISKEFENAIFIDDGSCDDTWSILSRESLPWMHAVRQSNLGAASARNRGLAESTARYVVFLDADDALDEGFLTEQFGVIETTQTDICFGPFRMEWPDGQSLRLTPAARQGDMDRILCDSLGAHWVALHAVTWRRSFLDHIGGWDARYSLNDDGELRTRAILEGAKISVADCEPAAVYKQHTSMSRISSRRDYAALESLVTLLEARADQILVREDLPRSKIALGRAALEAALLPYEEGLNDLGDRAITVWRRAGRPWPPKVRPLQDGFVRFLGLRRKAILARWLRKLRTRFAAWIVT